MNVVERDGVYCSCLTRSTVETTALPLLYRRSFLLWLIKSAVCEIRSLKASVCLQETGCNLKFIATDDDLAICFCGSEALVAGRWEDAIKKSSRIVANSI